MVKKLNVKVAWLTPVVGVDGKLLYWDRLFREFSGLFNEFRLFTLEFTGVWDIPNVVLEKCGTYNRLYKNERKVSTGEEGYVSGISLSKPYVIKRLKPYDPDLIITSEFGLFTLYAIIYSKLIKKTPIVLLVEAVPQFKDGIFIGILRRYFRKFICMSVDSIITNNNQGLGYLMDNFSIARNKIVVKPYLVTSFENKGLHRKGLSDEQVKFIYIGGLHKRKGLEYAISAFSKLSKKYNNFIFELIGDGPEMKSLVKQVEREQLTSHIIFHGKKDYDDLHKFYNKGDVFVFPTLGDYRALVTFEAISSGLAVIGSKYDGAVFETVSEGENGYIIDPRNIEDFAEKLAIFMEKPELIKEFSKKSLEINGKYTYQNSGLAIVEVSKLALEKFDQ